MRKGILCLIISVLLLASASFSHSNEYFDCLDLDRADITPGIKCVMKSSPEMIFIFIDYEVGWIVKVKEEQ